MAPSKHDRNPVDVLAEEFVGRVRAGQTPSIADYVTKYPQYAKEISDVFPAVLALEQLGGHEDRERKVAQRSSGMARVGQNLGDFRIVRQIGRGGMGIVYEAEQQSLKRTVALKLLPPDSTDMAQQKQRFRREAEAAARLHHTNIVPIFGIGRHDGVQYLVMQYIDGVGLDEVLVELQRLTGEEPNGSHHVEQAGIQTISAMPKATTAALRLRDGHFDGHAPSSSGDHVGQTMAALDGDPTVEHIPLQEGRTQPGKVAHDKPQPADVPIHAILGPPYWRSVAQVGAQIADALDHAHQHGVLHRDIKPSNLLFDRDGIVWVTDFGLAKHEDHDNVTRTGDVVGTLRYMAPEQFDGRTDSRSDVYALGLTLYELLTLHPAFAETQYGPLIQRKQQSDPPSLRLYAPTVPRDLETIVRKACARDPEHRYQHAGLLAADLRRFLDDRPVLARPVTSPERLWRWACRNPAVATLSSLTAILLVLVAVISSAANYRTRIALGEAENARTRSEAAEADANAQRELAEKNLLLAKGAMEEIVEKVASRGVPVPLDPRSAEEQAAYVQATLTAADAELLQSVLQFFSQLAQENQADLTVETASAQRRIGEIRLRLGQLELAREAYTAALTSYETLSAQEPKTAEHTLARAEILNELGVVAIQGGDVKTALDAHLGARRLLQRATASPQQQLELARTLNYVGSLVFRTGVSNVDAMMHMSRPGAPFGPFAGGPPPPPPREGGMLSPAAVADQMDSRLVVVKECCEQAMNLLTRLHRKDPQSTEIRLQLAECYGNHVRMAWADGDREKAESSQRAAIEILDQLVTEFPDTPRLVYELASTLILGAPPPGRSTTDYRNQIEQAIELSDGLRTTYPNVPHYQALWAGAVSRMAAIELQAGELTQAETDYRQAVDTQRRLVDEFPAVSSYRLAYVQSAHGLADVKRQQKNPRESLELLTKMVEEVKPLASAADGNPLFGWLLGPLYSSLSKTASELGNEDLAKTAKTEAENWPPRTRTESPMTSRPGPPWWHEMPLDDLRPPPPPGVPPGFPGPPHGNPIYEPPRPLHGERGEHLRPPHQPPVRE